MAGILLFALGCFGTLLNHPAIGVLFMFLGIILATYDFCNRR